MHEQKEKRMAFITMKSIALMFPLAWSMACLAPPAGAGEVESPRPVPESARVDAKATRVIFALDTGSCWGQSRETRTVDIGRDGVVIKADDKAQEYKRSLAWWEITRVLLNQGLAASRQKPKNGDCYLPNWICGFEIQVFVGKKKTTLSGCCNGSEKASRVEEAFRRLKSGGPLGPDRPPVP